MIQQIISAKLYGVTLGSGIISTALTFPSLSYSGRVSGSSVLIAGAVTTNIFSESSSTSIDVFSTDDIVVGVVIALLLAFTASFLQGRREQNDIVLWEKGEIGSVNTTDTMRRMFDADSWKEMSQPDNYVLYNQKVRGTNNQKKLLGDDVFWVEQSWVLLGLLVLFIPIFSVEFFFASSRQLICESGSSLVQPNWVELLCSPAK